VPVTVQGKNFVLPLAHVRQLWRETIAYRQHADDVVTVRSVSEDEMAELNSRYRGKYEPTNVLTFSYPSTGSTGSQHASSGQMTEHDVVLCIPVAEREAAERGVPVREHVAWLLVHAFLHAAGMDHERSPEAAQATEAAEQDILARSGFSRGAY